jgi:hypothetical protein
MDDSQIEIPHKLFPTNTHTYNSKKMYPNTTHNSFGMILILTFPKFPGDES